MEENIIDTAASDANFAIAQAKNSDTHMMAAKAGVANAVTSVYVAESIRLLSATIEESTGNTIKSSEKLAESNSKNTVALNYLTAALVIVGLLSLTWSIISFFIKN